jgi:uncharacterized protein YjbI with pentapeptide repeats
MKKLILILMVFLSTAKLFAYDQLAYARLMHGEKDLHGADLDGAIIQDIDLTEVDFTGANLRNVQIRNALISASTFDHVILQGAQISDVAFMGCEIRNKSSFDHATLDRVTFDHSEIADSFFNFATIHNTDFLNTPMTNTTMNNLIDGFKIRFIASKLNKVQFIGAAIRGLIICGTAEIGCELNFEGAQIVQALFLGNVTKSFLYKSNSDLALLNGCFLLNIKFENCRNIRTMAAGIKSIFSDVSFTNPEDIESLASKGAKVNGCYNPAHKSDWGNESDFFVDLIKSLGWGFVRGAAQVAGVGLVVELAPLAPAACVLL